MVNDVSRKDELLAVFANVDAGKKAVVINLIDEMVFVEEQLDSLREKPFIKVHPEHPELQKVTAAGKLYKEYMQQYTNIAKTLLSVLNREETTEDSPLREYFKKLTVR